MLFNKVLGKITKICIIENFLEDVRVYSDKKVTLRRALLTLE